MRMTCKDVKNFIALCVALFVVIGHMFIGYVFPTAACIIIAISYITLHLMGRTWLTVLWDIMVVSAYIAVDVITYNPEGISVTLYKYMLSIILAQLYSILLCIACSLSKRKAYNSKTLNSEEKKKRIRATLSVFGFYVIPTVVVISITGIRSAFTSAYENGIMYLTTSMIVLVVLAGIHFVTYTDTVLLNRAIEKSENEEGNKNEILEEINNGEGVGQDDERRADN